MAVNGLVLHQTGRAVIVGCNERRVGEGIQHQRRGKGVVETPDESVDLGRAVLPWIPDGSDPWLPTVVQSKHRPAEIVVSLLSIPAQSHVDREAGRCLPRILEIGGVRADGRLPRAACDRGQVVECGGNVTVRVVVLAVFIPVLDELAPAVEAFAVRPGILVTAAALDLVAPRVESPGCPRLVAARNEVIQYSADVAVPSGSNGRGRPTARLLRRSVRAPGVFGPHEIRGVESVLVTVRRPLHRDHAARPEQLTHAQAVVNTSERTCRVPGRRVAVRDGRHVVVTDTLAWIGAGRAGVRRRVGEHDGDNSRRGCRVPGQLPGVQIVRRLQRESFRLQDVLRIRHPGDFSAEVHAVECTEKPKAILDHETAEIRASVDTLAVGDAHLVDDCIAG